MLDAGSKVLETKPDQFLHHWRDMRDAKDEAADRSANVARTKKAAKRDGIDLDVVKMLEKLAALEDDEREVFLYKLETYSKWISLPLGAWSAGIAVTEPKQGTKDDFNAWNARQEGNRAGVAGHPKTGNPYKAGAREFVEWEKGWNGGFRVNQRKIAQAMVKKSGRAGAGGGGRAPSGKMAAAGDDGVGALAH